MPFDPTGTLPTHSKDLYDTLERGINNSNMPSWIELTGQNRADLVAFIKTFSPRWLTEKPKWKSIQRNRATSKASSAGKRFSRNWNAGKCHGQGCGDGPSASTLTDNNRLTIWPYNFAAGSRFKCGTTNEDLYKIFSTD